ncbi:hypothetical protein V6N11_026063 [Hibiscus sabdariffa]|uniref:Uncharacterized protein n=1 Tax=Hibiscus sabdariffa TaxID=183260 RepID=A0ABR2SVC3_9ROSI
MATLAKAQLELEELYLGIPDDSVNLTFQDLADMKQKANPSHNNHSTAMDTGPKQASSLAKLPSLDFSRGLQEVNHHQQRHLHHKHYLEDSSNFDSHMEMDHHRPRQHDHQYGIGDQPRHATSPRAQTDFRHGMERSMAYDDVSMVSMASGYPDRGQRRRPGIPHSNICTICSTYIYIFRHRCLAMRMYWHGRHDGRQKVCAVSGEKIQPKVHKKSRKDGLLLEVSKYGDASGAEVGGERASEKWGESRGAQFREHDVEGKKPSKESNQGQDDDDDNDK